MATSTVEQPEAPDIQQVHKAFCKKHRLRYVAKDLVGHLTGNCGAAAHILVDMMGPPARFAYGFWVGENKSKSSKLHKGDGPHRHGWVRRGPWIIDPTRWAFEDVDPYIWFGEAATSLEYDEGMRAFRGDFSREVPDRDDSEERDETGWDRDQLLSGLLPILFGEPRDWSRMTRSEMFWLGNVPPERLETFGPKVLIHLYEEFEKVGQRVLIPCDNWDYMESVRTNLQLDEAAE